MIDGNHVLVQPIPKQIAGGSAFFGRIKLNAVEKLYGIVAGVAKKSLRRFYTAVAAGRKSSEVFVQRRHQILRLGQLFPLRFVARKFKLHGVQVNGFKAGNGLYANKTPAVFSGMKVSTFQQDGIPEAVAEAQVDAHRRQHICQFLFASGVNVKCGHGISIKKNRGPDSVEASCN